MKFPTLIFIFLLLLCIASTQDGGGGLINCGFELEVANFLKGFDGHYFQNNFLSGKPVYGMGNNCIWCQHYIMYFFVTNSVNIMQECLSLRMLCAIDRKHAGSIKLETQILK
jgi:hypothetical protein